MKSEFELSHEKLLDLTMQYATFFGRCQGLRDLRDDNLISDFDVVLRLHELVATYEEVLKAVK